MSTTSEAADVHGSSQPATSNSSLIHRMRWCSECEPTEIRAVHYCSACDSALCDKCDKLVVHSSKTTAKHTRMRIDDYLVVERARGRSLPTDNEMNADEKNKFCFFSPIDHRIHLRPRLASLVKDPHAPPSLVAFIGPTGVGKSFLLRLLMSLDGEKDAGDIPLAGAPNEANSTSADLHMYAGLHKEYPLLYVDSEGRGGSNEPHAIQKSWNSLSSYFTSSGNDDKKEEAYNTFLRRRFTHVQVSYPRMLYIFSDVLCFVFSGDWREHKSIMSPLLEWGKTAADGAANQHLPQLILIFNKMGKEAPERKFDNFQSTYENWIEGGKNSDSDRELRRYYSNPLVILIPHMEIDLPMVMVRVKELGKEILESTTRIRKTRKEVNQLFSRRELHHCMQLAAETFSNKADAPFDIYKASMAQRPNSGGLAGHIIQFHKAVCDENEKSKKCKSSWESFRISLNVLQMRIKWSLLLWIDRVAPKVPIGVNLPEDLRKKLELAQTTIDGKMPCGAVRKFDGQIYHCDSLRVTHHHNQHCSRNQRWDGEFTPFHEVQLAANNCRLVNLGKGALKDRMDVQKIRERLSKVRREEHENYPWLKSVIFYQVCVSCMVDVPTEVLSCGHIICARCAKEEAEIREAKEKEEMHGTRKEAETRSPKVINLTCPVCLDSAKWYSKDLPPLAGYRILSLDGGGVRGIVELLSLQKIMSYLPGMHVEDLFDIIVGTSTGGIIALALTVHELDKEPKRLPDVIDLFENLCKKIFSKEMLRWGARYKPVLRMFQLAGIYNSKYKNDALLRLIKKHLGEESLLRSCVGGPHVIITSCDLDEELAPAWFTSDNRLLVSADKSDDKESQLASKVLEDESTEKESRDTGMSQPVQRKPRGNSQPPSKKTLGRVSNNHVFSAADVAAATSAAGTFFEPFKAGSRSWVDGGFRFNCPAWIAIKEAQILWPTCKASVLISLGCGELLRDEQDKKKRSGAVLEFLDLVVDIVTDADTQYSYAKALVDEIQPDSRCSFRLSPPIQLPKSENCELDRADKIPFLKQQTTTYLNSESVRGYVETAANLLFAALFYLHVGTNQDTQQPDLDQLCIRSRSTLPQELKHALIAACHSERFPFSVTIMPDAKPKWGECTWYQDVMNLPFTLIDLPPAIEHGSQLKVTVKLHMCLPRTSITLSQPISGMPCLLGRKT